MRSLCLARSALSAVFVLCWLLLVAPAAFAQPKVLLVVAHPDDELLAAASIYRLARERGGTVDQLVITAGEGGFRYSTLAEVFYGLALTKEDVARRELPDIRKREILASGRILGIRSHFFLDEPDVENTADPNAVLDGTWNVETILSRLDQLLEREKYDVVLTGLPRTDIGGHHLASTILTLRAVARRPAATRPVVLGGWVAGDPFGASTIPEAAGFSGTPDYTFNRTRKFGFNNALDYQIVVNWMIAEHKSQGLYQTNMNRSTHEYFWVFNRSDPAVAAKAKQLFALLD